MNSKVRNPKFFRTFFICLSRQVNPATASWDHVWLKCEGLTVGIIVPHHLSCVERGQVTLFIVRLCNVSTRHPQGGLLNLKRVRKLVRSLFLDIGDL